jgi:CRISPR-associated protein Cas1
MGRDDPFVSTLYIDHAGYLLEKDGGSLIVRDRSGKLLQRIPLTQLQRVILQGDMNLHTGLLLALARAGTEVICFGGRGGETMVQCLGPVHKDGQRRLAQYQLLSDPEKRRHLARLVLHGKLHGAARSMACWLRTSAGNRSLLLRATARWPALLREMDGADLDTLLGIEGYAAALYFPAFFSTLPKAFRVESRQRRPPPDPTNALLSLAYTLLHHESVHVAYAQGLDPYLGALHSPAFGRESLACDLVEPLRSEVDRWIAARLHDGLWRPEHFYNDRGAVFLGKAGRVAFYREWMQVAPHFRKRLRRWARLALRFLEVS